MQPENKPASRRKVIIWGASILSGLSILSFGIFRSKKKETVKLLSQDGELVEVDKRLLTGKGKKINNKDLLSWIKTK